MAILLLTVFAATLAAALAANRALNPQADPARARLRALAGGLAPRTGKNGPAPDHHLPASPHHSISRSGRARGL